MTVQLDLDALNDMGRDQFTAALADVFEHSPWIPARAWRQRPFVDIASLHRAMVRVVGEASSDEQLALLQAHPELAGREARAGELTAASGDEQAGAGLDALDKEQLAEIARLNADYRSTFGFPFIIAVRNHTRETIVSEWQRRLTASETDERAAALAQVYRIARLRLDAMLSDSSPESTR